MTGVYLRFLLGIIAIAGCRDGDVLSESSQSELRDKSSNVDSDEFPAPIRIGIVPENPIVMLGRSIPLKAIGYYPYEGEEDLTDLVEWDAIDDDAFAFVAIESGLMKSNRVGQFELKASFKGIVGSTVLKITDAEVRTILIRGPKNQDYIDIGDDDAPILRKIDFTALGTLSNLSVVDVTETAVWTSSNPEVAVFEDESKPILTAVKPGSVEITATKGNIVGRFQLELVPREKVLDRISFSQDIVSLPIGANLTITVTGHYSNGTSADISESVDWLSVDTSVATVANEAGSKGRIVSIGPGTTELTASLDGIVGKLPYASSQAKLDRLQINPANHSTPIGVAVIYSVTGFYSDGSSYDLTSLATWQVTGASNATISDTAPTKGRLSPTAIGANAVKATVLELSTETNFSVTAAIVNSLTIGNVQASYPKGRTINLTAVANFSDGSSAIISALAEWSSTNPTSIPVSNVSGSKGRITCSSIGQSIVSAVYSGVTGSATIDVTAAVVDTMVLSAFTGNASVAKGLSKQLVATATYSDGVVSDISETASWGVDLSGTGYAYVASVSNSSGTKGRVTSFAQGKMGVSAVFGSLASVIEFTVTEKAILSIIVTSPSNSVQVASNLQMTATASYTDGSTGNLTDPSADPDLSINWSSSNDGIFTVDNVTSLGLLTGVSAGSATVTATLASNKFGIFSHNKSITVTDP